MNQVSHAFRYDTSFCLFSMAVRPQSNARTTQHLAHVPCHLAAESSDTKLIQGKGEMLALSEPESLSFGLLD